MVESAPLFDMTETSADMICAICQDTMDDTTSIVHLDCLHSFHAQCAVTHLQRDPRCPMCRNNPNDKDESSSESDESMPGEQGVSLKEAIGAAKRAARKDDKLAKQFKNLNKWHQTEKDERRKVRSIHTILRPL